MRKLLLTALVIFGGVFCAGAADEAPLRPVTSAYTINIGGSRLADTYLSPLRYSGFQTGLTYERMQAFRHNPRNNVTRLVGGLTFDKTHNPVGNANIYRLALDFGVSVMRRWRLDCGLTLAVGPEVGLNLGALYASRNGNNPVGVEAALTAGATGYASYTVMLRRLPVTLRYQPSLPLLGAFFSPDYGELYYEIYLGNRSGLAHFAWPGSYFAMRNTLTADFRFGATWLRVGYAGMVRSTHVSHLTTRTISHCLSIGVAGEWLSLDTRRRRPSADAAVISALY